MRYLLLIITCSMLTACLDQPSSSQVSAKADSIADQNIPIPTPTPYASPTSVSGAEQEFRGTYKLQTDSSSTITINSNYTFSTSIPTKAQYIVSGVSYGFVISTTCVASGDQVAASQPVNGVFRFTVRALTNNYYGTEAEDCITGGSSGGPGGQYVDVSFVSEKCVDLAFYASTGVKRYCKD